MAITVTHVAIKRNEVVYSLPCPWRHSHLFLLMPNIYQHTDVQGFVVTDVKDASTEFVTRRTALTIAKKRKQLLSKQYPASKELLYSEDVWSSDLFNNGLSVDYDIKDAKGRISQSLFVKQPFAGVIEDMLNNTQYNNVFSFDINEFKKMVQRAHWSGCVYPVTELTLMVLRNNPDYKLISSL